MARTLSVSAAALLSFALVAPAPASSGVVENANANATSPSIDRFVGTPARDIPTDFRPTRKAVSKALKVKFGSSFATTSSFFGVVYSQITYSPAKTRTLSSAGGGVASAESWETLLNQYETYGGGQVTQVGDIAYVSQVNGTYQTAIKATDSGYAAMGQCIYNKKVKVSASRACAKKMLNLVIARPI